MAALALLSGGLDSMVAATHAARHGGLALALTIDYDQRAAQREREASAAIARFLCVEHKVVSIPFLKEISATALMNRQKSIPDVKAGGLDNLADAAERARQVWVPNRNGLFIHIAACFAEACGLDSIVVGFNVEEAATFPDNRAGFLEACTQALSFTLNPPVRVVSPTVDLEKTGIVRLGKALKAPFHLVWSCYEAGPGHCMRCESCMRLKRALKTEGLWNEIGPHLSAKDQDPG
ncbi:MAG: 7-cyano-7-deazaguanine synthase QueC [Planctomycetota bacterium]